MKRAAALGVQMHSGWGVLVAVAGETDSLEIVDRRRIVVANSVISGAIQPYHYAASLPLHESEPHLANCAAASERLATQAIGEVLRELAASGYRVAGCAVLFGSGRPLPPLPKILAAHPLIHTAEGEFFRNAAVKACEHLKIPVSRLRERDLTKEAKTTFGSAEGEIQARILGLGRSIGPPWTKDHKTAALAAATTLARGSHSQSQ